MNEMYIFAHAESSTSDRQAKTSAVERAEKQERAAEEAQRHLMQKTLEAARLQKQVYT